MQYCMHTMKYETRTFGAVCESMKWLETDEQQPISIGFSRLLHYMAEHFRWINFNSDGAGIIV